MDNQLKAYEIVSSYNRDIILFNDTLYKALNVNSYNGQISILQKMGAKHNYTHSERYIFTP